MHLQNYHFLKSINMMFIQQINLQLLGILFTLVSIPLLIVALFDTDSSLFHLFEHIIMDDGAIGKSINTKKILKYPYRCSTDYFIDGNFKHVQLHDGEFCYVVNVYSLLLHKRHAAV